MSPLSKSDAPRNRGVLQPSQEESNLADNDKKPEANPAAKVDEPKPASAADNAAAKKDILDAGAGVPASLDAAADALPEKDAVQKAYKQQAKADSVKEEVAAKVIIVKESPDAAETPSGGALLAVAGESDPIKQGERYSREKSARRWGYVPAESAAKK